MGQVKLSFEEEIFRTTGIKPINQLGTCFLTVWQYMLSKDNATAVHALCHSDNPAEKDRVVAHAWVELNKDGKRAVYDTTWGLYHDVNDYRSARKITKLITYDKKKFINKWKRYNTGGPWDKEILEAANQVKFRIENNGKITLLGLE